jgi:hypothetical protein
MGKIPLKEAIASGAWLECHARDFDGELHFRLRVVAFEQSSVDEIGGSRLNVDRLEGILWLLGVEVVNLCKTSIKGCKIKYNIKLIDDDGYEFESFHSDLDYKTIAGLLRFADISPNPPLLPKIKASGSVAFVLPDEDAIYYLAVKDGSIRE